jgi:hypothetical protein
MSVWRRVLMCGLVAAAAGGCAFGRKPYAEDPLIRSQKAVWGDREKARTVSEEPPPEPLIPPAPNLELVGTVR